MAASSRGRVLEWDKGNKGGLAEFPGLKLEETTHDTAPAVQPLSHVFQSEGTVAAMWVTPVPRVGAG